MIVAFLDYITIIVYISNPLHKKPAFKNTTSAVDLISNVVVNTDIHYQIRPVFDQSFQVSHVLCNSRVYNMIGWLTIQCGSRKSIDCVSETFRLRLVLELFG